MPIYTLGIPVDRQGYTVDEGDTNVAIQLDGGAPRVRGDKLGAVKTVHCQWTVDQGDYDYLEAFYRTATGNGALPFNISLVGIDSSTPNTYVAYFVPNTKRLLNQSGLTYVLGADLWVVPNQIDPNADLQLIGEYS